MRVLLCSLVVACNAAPMGPAEVAIDAPTVDHDGDVGLTDSAGSGAPVALALDIPISPAGYFGQFNMSSNAFVAGYRFILDRTVTIDRWYFQVKGYGTTCWPRDPAISSSPYGAGNGGTWYGRIVTVDATTGHPTQTVLASETVAACTAYTRSRAEFGYSTIDQAQWVELAPVTLAPNTMYAFLLSNTDPQPGSGGNAGSWTSSGVGSNGNHMSINCNFARLAEMGPNGTATLDAHAAGATYGADPRETTLWSANGGATWKFGDQVGWYSLGNGAGRMWPNPGYRLAADGTNVARGWPYGNDPGESAATVTYRSVPSATTLTFAGAANSSGNVGVITVRNTRTGVVGKTAALGSGMVRSALTPPVPIAAGDTFTVQSAGRVDVGSGSYWAPVFGLGTRAPYAITSACSTCGGTAAHAMLYAGPYPFYATGGP